jgi:hypothetical protein
VTRGSDHAVLFDRLSEAVRVAPKATPDIVSQIIAGACSTHEVMPLAIFLAFLEARRRMSLAAQPVVAVPASNQRPSR